MFTYISIEEFADGVVKNNKDANRRELIAALRESLAYSWCSSVGWKNQCCWYSRHRANGYPC